MFIHNIDPVLISIGPLEIRYYGLFYLLGFIIAYFLILKLTKIRNIELTKDDVSDYLLYLFIGVVLGARIFYVFVYNPVYYLSNITEIIAIWQGGLSFHGGLIGALISSYYFCKKKNISLLALADVVSFPLSLALALGRLGNFMNGELYGRITNVPWAFKFQDAEGYRHPSQIYESIKNLIIFGFLWLLKDKNLPNGSLFSFFLISYSVLRFSVEFFRAPDPQLDLFLGFLTMGQILSVLTFIAGIVLIRKIKS